ncbi:putative ABC transport system ATP-binding protein [Plantibacter sp. VKM Ac-1784]|uniref:ABC transport system ATP-binding protein n=1 Tax=Plantibacter elymi (nom. nud.) TaxID=199708 RepID=A0ABY1RAV9_9MICO|nr:ATP-binding cassette domain-containing protein [Plantibacter sp. VKM Ac-1784]SMQ59434.1 putative ABC transport system ATP-binding protein [Plantibacter sp. VKM Ac-1784]
MTTTRSRPRRGPAPAAISIDAHDIRKTIDGRPIWSGLSFTLDHPGLIALSGPSGSGKTTLLNCLGLLDTVSGGELIIDGNDVTKPQEERRRQLYRHRIGFLFQNYGLVETWTADQNIAVAARFVAAGKERVRLARREALERVGLAGRHDAKIHTLSGGEQQRVALARLIVKRPALILADEPTSALDTTNAALVLDTLRELADDGALVILATHHRSVIERCDALLSLP